VATLHTLSHNCVSSSYSVLVPSVDVRRWDGVDLPSWKLSVPVKILSRCSGPDAPKHKTCHWKGFIGHDGDARRALMQHYAKERFVFAKRLKNSGTVFKYLARYTIVVAIGITASPVLRRQSTFKLRPAYREYSRITRWTALEFIRRLCNTFVPRGFARSLFWYFSHCLPEFLRNMPYVDRKETRSASF
jgi:hypothetical protein